MVSGLLIHVNYCIEVRVLVTSGVKKRVDVNLLLFVSVYDSNLLIGYTNHTWCRNKTHHVLLSVLHASLS